VEEQLGVSFGKAVRRLRLAAGLTQEQLGQEAGLQRNFVSSIELGQKQPSLVTIFKLASALRVAPGKLLDLAEQELRLVWSADL
jgi:transcriptional regulator with XRE-family HTH domain